MKAVRRASMPTKLERTQMAIKEIRRMKSTITEVAADIKEKLDVILSKDYIPSTAKSI
jgi:hypothetical protein